MVPWSLMSSLRKITRDVWLFAAFPWVLFACGTTGNEAGRANSAPVMGGPAADAEVDAEDKSDGGKPSAGNDGSAASNLPFRVGVSFSDVTPTSAELDTKQLFLGGYGTPIVDQRAADGVADAMVARALAIESDGSGLVVAVLDVPGISNRVMHAIEDKVAAATGLSRESIWVSATHSHAGLDFQGLWGGVTDEYKQRVIAATADAMISAYDQRVPASLHVSRGEHDAKNRRDWEMTDRELNVLSARDERDQLIAVLVNFAAHPTALPADNTQISGDYCNYLREDVSKALADVPVLFINGMIGDVLPKIDEAGFAAAEAYGSSIARAVLGLVEESQPLSPGLRVARASFTQPVENTSFIAAMTAGLLDYDYQMQGLGLTVDTQVSLARLGVEAQIVAFPGESLTRNGLPIKDAMKAPYRFFFGLTTDTLGYFVPNDEWNTDRNGNYEEGVSLGQSAGDAAQAQAIELVEEDNALLP